MNEGAAWHGPVPHGWESAPLKAMAQALSGATPDSSNEAFWCEPEDGLPWVAIADMSGRDTVCSTMKALTPEGQAEKGLRASPAGTLLFAMYASVGEVARLGIPATWNQAILGLTPYAGRAVSRYLQYALMAIRPHLALDFRSNTQNNLNAWQVAHLRMPCPPLRVQQAIADFLDRETSQIDAMIEAQVDVVRLAFEHRASVVAEEISVCTANSDSVALRHCLQVQAGVTLGKQYGEESNDYPYLRVANVQAGYLDLENVKTVRVPSEVAAASTLRSGDVLITEGGDRAALGRGALWRDEIPGALHQNHIFALRCGPLLDPEFLVYVLDAPDARIYFESTRRQTTNLSSTNSSKVKAFKTPLPPISEQKMVVERLNQVLSRVDDVIVSAQKVSDLFRERREALITAAVTGRIEPATGIERTDPTTYQEAS